MPTSRRVRQARNASKSALIVGFTFAASWSSAAWAQQPPGPGSITDIVVEQTRIIEEYTVAPRRGTVSLSVADIQKRIPEEAAEQVTFVLRSVTVEGATLLPASRFAPLWRDLIGKQIRLSDIYAIPQQIETIYRRSGTLAMAVVPDQDVADGHVRIVVYDQSYVRRVEFEMNRPGLRSRLAPYIDQITAMRPLYVARIERLLLLMSDLAGMTIEATLTKPEEPGEGGSLVLELTFKPWTAQFGLDNRGSESVGPLQLSANYIRNDLFGLFETTSLTGVTVPDSPRELLFGQIGQDVPIGKQGFRIGYTAGHASSHPGGDLADADVRVKTAVGDVHASYPFLRRIDNSIYGELRFKLTNTDVDVMRVPKTRERARWLEFALNSENALPRGSAAISLAFWQGLDILGATKASSQFAGRIGGKPDFRLVQAGASATLSPIEMIVLSARGAAQYAFDPVPASVRFSVGGEPYGRAFDATTISGDSGAAASLELGIKNVGKLPLGAHMSPYTFADYGRVWNRGHLLEYDHASIASAGLGIRAMFPTRTRAEATVALPIHASDKQFDEGVRLFFRIGQMF